MSKYARSSITVQYSKTKQDVICTMKQTDVEWMWGAYLRTLISSLTLQRRRGLSDSCRITNFISSIINWVTVNKMIEKMRTVTLIGWLVNKILNLGQNVTNDGEIQPQCIRLKLKMAFSTKIEFSLHLLSRSSSPHFVVW